MSGNHEAVISQYDVLKSGLETSGVIVLEDEAINMERNGDNITLIAPNQGLFPKYGAGLYTEGDTNMVVSRG